MILNLVGTWFLWIPLVSVDELHAQTQIARISSYLTLLTTDKFAIGAIELIAVTTKRT